MNQRQESKNSSYKTLSELFTGNESTLTTLPSAAKIVGEFRTNCTKIDNLAARQDVDKSGLRDNKEIRREAAIIAGLDVAKRIAAYATIEENATLITQAKLTETELRKLADTKLTPKLMAILALANTYADPLVAYGVTADVTTNLGDAINAYAAAVPQPKLGIDEIKQITSELDVIFKNNDTLLRKMDALAELEKAGHPNFYNSYKNLRKVVVFGRGSLAMKGLVKDAATGEGISNVDVLIEPKGDGGKAPKAGADLAKNVKSTTRKGNFTLKTLPEGKYTFTISKLGYITQVVTVNVVAGELSKVEVMLVSE